MTLRESIILSPDESSATNFVDLYSTETLFYLLGEKVRERLKMTFPTFLEKI